MLRYFLLLLALLIVGGALYFALTEPPYEAHRVEKTIDNDRLGL